MTEATGSFLEARPLDRRVVVVWTVQEAAAFGVLAVAVLAADLAARLGGVDLPGPPGLAAGLLAVVGVARLVVHTASAGTDATIPGIAAGDAEGLRRLILARAGSGDAV
jgi:hypothetical protein